MLYPGDHMMLILGDSKGECVIDNLIGGSIFKVTQSNKKYALKWVDSTDYLHYNRSFYENTKGKCIMGSPNNSFLWPINISDYSDVGFGYIMEIIPEEYISMSDWLIGKAFVSTQVLVRVALNIVESVRSLGIHGFCGADLHDGK